MEAALMVWITSDRKTTYACAKFPGYAHVSLDINKRLLRSHGHQCW